MKLLIKKRKKTMFELFLSPNCGVWLWSWYLYNRVAQNVMRTLGVNKLIRSVCGICLHRKQLQVKKKYFHYTCATCSKQPSYISTMDALIERGKSFLEMKRVRERGLEMATKQFWVIFMINRNVCNVKNV